MKYQYGNTQQKLKTRMTQHFMGTRKAINCRIPIDPFANHFDEHCEEKLKNGIYIYIYIYVTSANMHD